MKIADLKQPYIRMADYLNDENKTLELSDVFFWFYKGMCEGKNPEITEEIKKNFPPDFDFSGEKPICSYSINSLGQENISLFDKENQRKIEDENLQNRIYTQLAKEGKFDELPDTCEFSEAVELEVWDKDKEAEISKGDVLGKFKGKFIAVFINSDYAFWNYAQLPTPKIDFSEFKPGDVVEVELSNEEKRIGWFDFTNNNHLYIRILQRKGNQICNGGSCAGTKIINKEKIKSITKIK